MQKAGWLYSFGVIVFWLIAAEATAQIRPDRNLPTPSAVPQNCTDCEITGGTRAGSNLFHSFRQFSVPTGGRAYFNNSTDVQNIFSRVTGSSRSVINGVLQANGTANLFLLNPNGIRFGENARLNLGGSFFATTADQISFADQSRFSTVQPEQSLLTVSIPTGLQFGSRPGSIVSHAPMIVQPEQRIALIANGLTLDDSSLVANSGSIELGSVAPGSSVSLTPNRSRFNLDYGGQNFSDIAILNGSVITTSGLLDSPTMSQRSGGFAQLQGRNIQISGGSILYSGTYEGQGGNQRLIASRSLTLRSAAVGTGMLAQGSAGNIFVQADFLALQTGADRSFLASQTATGSTGRAGNLTVRANQIALSGGSRLETATFGTGRGGNLVIRAENLEVSGFYPRRIRDLNGDNQPEKIGEVSTGISAQAERSAGAEAGNAGRITIQTDRLVVRDGGLISTATFAGGDGGNLQIQASEILLEGVSPAAARNPYRNQYRSGIFVSAEPGATGRAGGLRLTANQLTLADRAQISARNRGSGQPGQATLNLGDLTVQGGSEISASTEGSGRGGRLTIEADSIQVSGSGQLGVRPLPSSLSALSTQRASGEAGNLRINATNLTVQEGAVVSVSGEGQGAAGNLTVTADQIQLNQGRLEASTQAGNGAEIALQTTDLILLRDQSAISARAFNQADGGNIRIQAPEGYLLAGVSQNNDIVANAGQGAGGEITANLRGLLGLKERLSTPLNQTNDIDASSEQGAQGIVNVTQPDIDPSQGIVELPANLVDAASLIAQTCPSGSTVGNHLSERLSEFVITGRGGLPPSPSDPRDEDAVTTEWATLSNQDQEHQEHQREAKTEPDLNPLETDAKRIVEAQGWVQDNNGNVLLLAQAPTVTPQPARSIGCHPPYSQSYNQSQPRQQF